MNNGRKIIRPISADEALQQLQNAIIGHVGQKKLRIFEAGGGSMSILPPSVLNNATISVVDLDERQLRKNNYADVKIRGDIQNYSFSPSSFDLVVCYNVIEHLDFVDKAIRKFYDALAPGGLLVIGAPNPKSPSSLVTRYSPHWFHVWVYRVVLRRSSAGKPGEPPFRTVFHQLVLPKALWSFSTKLGFDIIYFCQYRSISFSSINETRPLLGRIIYAAAAVMNALTLGRLDLNKGDYHMILEKRGGVGGLDPVVHRSESAVLK